jgi:AcrR family transcriptional regulator
MAASPLEALQPAAEPDFHQERSRRSYLSLLEAATDLFSAHGYDSVGTPEIAQQAGVSVGTFYRYFHDKHAVYLEIVRRTMSMAFRETMQDLNPEKFARAETITETITLLFKHVLARPELTRSIREMSLRDPQVGELTRAFQQIVVGRIAALVSATVPREVVADPEATAYVIYGCAMECAYGLAGHGGPPPVDRERAKRALAEFIERALFPTR